MKFNELKVGMIVGEVLSKPEKPTNYVIKIITSIKEDSAKAITYSAYVDGNEFYTFPSKTPTFYTIKNFGLAKPIDDFGIDDKINFVKTIFGVNT